MQFSRTSSITFLPLSLAILVSIATFGMMSRLNCDSEQQIRMERRDSSTRLAVIRRTYFLLTRFDEAVSALLCFSITKSPAFGRKIDEIAVDVPHQIKLLNELALSDREGRNSVRNVSKVAQAGVQSIAQTKTDIDFNRIDGRKQRMRDRIGSLHAIQDEMKREIEVLRSAMSMPPDGDVAVNRSFYALWLGLIWALTCGISIWIAISNGASKSGRTISD